jgi:hypothetical protein
MHFLASKPVSWKRMFGRPSGAASPTPTSSEETWSA